MGMDITVKVLKKSREDNFYHELKLFTTAADGKYTFVPVYSGRDRELFDVLLGRSNEYNLHDFPSKTLNLNSLDSLVAESVNADKETNYYFGFREVNLADFKIWLYENPMMEDYEEELPDGSPKIVENIAKHLLVDIVNYITFADPHYRWGDTHLSDYKIIYYFDN